MSLLRDEQGNWSMARTLLVYFTGLLSGVIALDLFTSLETPEVIYLTLGALWPLLATWAAGPRMAQYLAPAAAKIGSSVASAVAKVASGEHRSGYEPPPGFKLDSVRFQHESDEE